MATYPFVAAPDHWPRNGVPILAIAIHHAEGGGTVSWLKRDDGNSSHYVVEYSGRVVQMVREDRAAGSINPTLVRTNDDPPFIFEGETIVYGATANKAALGSYWRNPNAAVIAIEVEGFARDGPNDAQRSALAALVADIRSRNPGIPALGHRDWQNYKACPGKKVPWLDYGGHGKQIASDDVTIPISTTTAPGSYDVDLTVGDQLYDQSFAPLVQVSVAQTADGYFVTGTGFIAIEVVTGGVKQLAFVKGTAVTIRLKPVPPAPVPDCSSEVAAAITADRAKAKVVWG